MARDGGPAAEKTVLLVDDSASVRGILEFLLKSKGYRIRQAVDGGDALEKIAAETPDLIVLDAMMPVKTGFEVCVVLKSDERTRGIPVIMLTAMADTASETIRRINPRLRPDYFVSKPFKVNQLIEQIRSLLPDSKARSSA